MIRNILFFVSIFFSIHLFAQTGIGTTNPDASAKLDVSSTNKGFLPPRVSLTGVTDNTTISSPATGLLVYCKGDAGLAAGYYYWNGNAWATIATAGGSGSFASSFMRGSRTATQSIAVSGVVAFSNIDNSSGGDISLNTSTGKITLAPGNTYRLRAAVPNFSSGQRPAFIWYNETTSANVGSATFSYNPGDAASLGAFGAPAELIITPTVSTVLSFRLLSSLSSGNVTVGGNGDFSTAGSYPWFEAQVISGNAPVNGQSVDYVSVGSIYLTGVGDNRDLVFPTKYGGNIPYNTSTGVFTLSANKTYLFQAQVRVNAASAGGDFIEYGFVDAVSNALLVNGTQTITSSSTSTAGYGSNPVINFIYTPTSNQTVKIRTTSITTGTQTVVSGTANITQIGSSAFVSPWTLSGTNTYNTTGNVGIGTTTPATTLDVNGTLQVSGNTTLKSNLNIGTGVGAEGGEIQLVNAVTGSTLSGTAVSVDIYQDRLRIFEGGGNNRGVFVDLAKAPSGVGGELTYKASSFVNRGVDVTLGNLKARIAATGNFSVQLSTVSGSYSVYGSHYLVDNGAYSNGIDGSSPLSITTTPTYINSGNNFLGAGNTSVWLLMDTTAKMSWRITMIVGAGYTNNFISIERL